MWFRIGGRARVRVGVRVRVRVRVNKGSTVGWTDKRNCAVYLCWLHGLTD